MTSSGWPLLYGSKTMLSKSPGRPVMGAKAGAGRLFLFCFLNARATVYKVTLDSVRVRGRSGRAAICLTYWSSCANQILRRCLISPNRRHPLVRYASSGEVSISHAHSYFGLSWRQDALRSLVLAMFEE